MSIRADTLRSASADASDRTPATLCVSAGMLRFEAFDREGKARRRDVPEFYGFAWLESLNLRSADPPARSGNPPAPA